MTKINPLLADVAIGIFIIDPQFPIIMDKVWIFLNCVQNLFPSLHRDQSDIARLLAYHGFKENLPAACSYEKHS
jgi:hypothetical protein